LDEYGYYAVKGFAVVPAQARSLGFSVVFAGQDLPAFQKVSKEEAASIGANTNIKICMKLEDPQETWEFFSKTAGESFVTQVESYQANAGSVSNSYQDSKAAKVEKRARVDLLDLKEQVEGDMHIFFKSKIIRARSFYVNPRPVKEMRVNQMLKIDLPTDPELYTLVKGIEDFEVVANKASSNVEIPASSMLSSIASSYSKQLSKSSIESSINVLMDIYEQHADIDDEDTEDIALTSGEAINIFSKFTVDPERHVILGSLEIYEVPLLDKGSLYKQLNYISRLLGMDEDKSNIFTKDIISDILSGTYYANPSVVCSPVDTVASTAKDLVKIITEAKNEHAKIMALSKLQKDDDSKK